MENKFGNTLKKLRNEKGLTQVQLSKKLGISLSCLAMYETGDREPNRENREKLCNYFNVDLNYLFGMSDIKNSYTKREHVVQIPLYDSIGGGDDAFNDENIVENMILPDLVLSHKISYFALQVKDFALSGSGIRENDILVFEKDDATAPNEIGCFRFSNKTYIRKYYTDKNKRILKSNGEGYDDIDVSNKEFTCLGKLVTKISRV